MISTTFKTMIKGFGNNAGIEVPLNALNDLGNSKRPPVKVIVNSYSYQSTVGVMSGMYLISLPKSHREASGLAAGDEITVRLELIEGTREVDLPVELRTELEKNKLTDSFNSLAYSKRKEFARQVAEAKSAETVERRVEKIINGLRGPVS